MSDADTLTISRAEFERLLERLEDMEASLALLSAQREDDGTRIPHEVVKAEVAGDHPVTAWRKYRGLTARQLAERAGISAGYLSEIVTGKKPGSVEAYRALGRVLGAPIDVLSPERD